MSQMRSDPLMMWGQASESPPPEWEWVESRLSDADLYWVVTRSEGYPHPRPVWGVWMGEALLLSVGSPVIGRELGADPRVTVHLDSGTDVVIVEGVGSIVTRVPVIESFADCYNRKYEWEYSAERDGPPTRIEPRAILSWRAAGAAGRDGFPQAARWKLG